MRLQLTLLLVFLNICLFGFIFYANHTAQSRVDTSTQSRLVLQQAFSAALNRVSIVYHETGDQWTLEKIDGSWQITEPFSWRANPFAIEQLLFQLESMAWEARFQPDTSQGGANPLSAYNLENPPIEIRMQAGNSEHSLFIGNPTEIGNRLYIQLSNQDTIFVTDQSLLRTLQRDPMGWLDSNIFTIAFEQVRALQILDRSDSNVRIRLVREGNSWAFVSPIEAKADSDRVNALLEDWQLYQINRFLRAGDVPTLPETSHLRLTLEGLSESQTLRIYVIPDAANGRSRFLAKADSFPAIFEISPERVQSLRRAQETLRETRILRPMAQRWTSLQIQSGTDSLTLQRLENGPWQVLRTNRAGDLQSLPADERRIAELKNYFQHLEAVRFVSDSPTATDRERFGLLEPQRILTLRADGEPPLELRVGQIAGEGTLFHAQLNRADAVFLLPASILAMLPLNPRHYQDRKVRAIGPSEHVQSIALIHRSSGLPLLESVLPGSDSPETSAQQMELVASPTSSMASETESLHALEQLHQLARNLELERLHHRPFSDPMRLDSQTDVSWDYLIEIAIVNENGTPPNVRTETLFLTQRLGGTTQFLGDPISGLVGTIDNDLIDALDPILARFPEAAPEEPVFPSD